MSFVKSFDIISMISDELVSKKHCEVNPIKKEKIRKVCGLLDGLITPQCVGYYVDVDDKTHDITISVVLKEVNIERRTGLAVILDYTENFSVTYQTDSETFTLSFTMRGMWRKEQEDGNE